MSIKEEDPDDYPIINRRRKFCGDQFDSPINTSEAESSKEETTTSTKRKKADVTVNLSHCYRIIEFVSVFAAIADIVICKTCKQKLTFGESSNRGLGFKISVKCRCGTTLINSSPFIRNRFEINRRIVFAMRLVGVAREGINIFCGIMDFGHGLSKRAYDGIVWYIYVSVKKMFDYICKKAVEEEIKLNKENERPLLNVKVSGDDFWKKSGSSLSGVTMLIAYYTGKIIDIVVKGSYCQACIYCSNKIKNDSDYLEHIKQCPINHVDFKKKMKVDSVLEMFQRSEELFGIKYSNYISNGDVETFKAILDVQPYGDFKIRKNNCVSYLKNLIRNDLRTVKKNANLEGKLTDTLIEKLTKYYGLAISRNINSVEEMQKDIMATFYHMTSTDEDPQHQNCPAGSDSWCQWRVAEAEDKKYKHPFPLHLDVKKHLLPIYEQLSRQDLLETCLRDHTQNANKISEETVWRMTPTFLNCGIKINEIAAFLAAGMFNEGYTFILQVMQDLELIIGQQCKTFADAYDMQLSKRQERHSRKEARSAWKIEQAILSEFEEEEEVDFLYGPDISD